MGGVSVHSEVERAIVGDFKEFLAVTAHWMAAPLFLIFWFADLLYVPELKWPFLFIRLLILPLCLLVTKLSIKAQKIEHLQLVAAAYAISMAAGINLMIFLIKDPSTGYYAGLNLIAIGCLSFLPFSRLYLWFTAAGIYTPYYVITIPSAIQSNKVDSVLLNSFFAFSTVCMCYLIRHFNDRSRRKEIDARLQLRGELESREEVIRNKTDEAVKLRVLSSQFSPQIVESIRSGKIQIENGGQRAEICTIFIDIVNSTERVTRIDKDKVERVLSRFLDDSIKTMLKYDLTIDKFLGDGILAFCNAPLTRSDYVARVVRAAIEVRERIQMDQDFYEKNWLRALDIRIGVSKGYVNVGFYGSQKYYRSYTAIGPVVNLASRLCGAANPNQILCDNDVYEEIKNEFECQFVGKKHLKGFEEDVIHVFEIKECHNSAVGMEKNECSSCGGLLSLETNEKGQFIFICKSCNGDIVGSIPSTLVS